MERKDLEEIAKVVIEKDLYVISDEIYGELTYSGKHVSIVSLPGMKERTILINGFSKAYAMTGWRLGYACGPAKIMEQMIKIVSDAAQIDPMLVAPALALPMLLILLVWMMIATGKKQHRPNIKK